MSKSVTFIFFKVSPEAPLPPCSTPSAVSVAYVHMHGSLLHTAQLFTLESDSGVIEDMAAKP